MPNYLKKMKIQEISLVTRPASPGAEVLFTKSGEDDWRSLVVKARNVSAEPRDKSGRWTTGAMAALGHAKGVTREFAQAIHDRAKEAARSVVGNLVNTIKTTRAVGAHPVAGGGVHFMFRHDLLNGDRIHTAVQIRPEHLPSSGRRTILPVKDPVSGKVTGAQTHTMPGAWHHALGAMEGILRRMPGSVEQKPFSNKKIFTTSKTPRLEVLQGEAAEREKENQRLVNEAAAETRHRNAMAAAKGEQPRGGLFDQHNNPTGSGYRSDSPNREVPSFQNQPVAVSTPSGPGGLPSYSPPTVNPYWAQQSLNARQGNFGRRSVEGHPIPTESGVTAMNSGGWPYMYKGTFVPGMDPKKQKHIQDVIDWENQNPDTSTGVIAARTQDRPLLNGGRGYFMAGDGHYVPPGSDREQAKVEQQYRDEDDRILGEMNRQANETHQHVRDIMREEYRPGQFEAMIHHVPEDPALSSARQGSGQTSDWGVKKSGGPAFAPFLTAKSPTPIAYARAVAKARVR